MPFKSEKQRRWMHANEPKMAKKWEKEKKMKKETKVRELIRKMVSEIMAEKKNKGLYHNIHAKRKRGESPAKPGDKDYPKTLDVEGKIDESWGIFAALAVGKLMKYLLKWANKNPKKVKELKNFVNKKL